MSLLDSVSLYSNNIIITKWANGKTGAIIPTDKCLYIFVEHEDINGHLQMKYQESEWEEKCPVLAYGFVFHWLRNRKRKTKRAERLDLFAPEDRGKTPKEIYDLYIQTMKAEFLEYMSNRPDSWEYPDLEKLFYEKNITADSERELILKSEPLLEYLDEEDQKEFIEVMKNFLGYVSNIVEPYQHVMKNTARQKRLEQSSRSMQAFSKRVREEMEARWPNPKRKYDDKVYTIDSPEIIGYAKNLTPIQTEILRQLVANAGEIKIWQENPILNQYSEPEIWEACCPLFTECIICAFIDWGHVSALQIEDKGKLVLRKKNSLDNKEDTSKSQTPQKHDEQNKDVSTTIPEKYLKSVESVFHSTYRWCDEEFPVYLNVRETGKNLLDPNEPPSVPIFIKACISMKCARECSLMYPKKIVEALIGLRVLQLCEDDIKNFSDSVGRKINRLKGTKMTANEMEYYDSVVESLKRPSTE